MTMSPRCERLFEDFSKLKVLIIGDVMIDSYIWGKAERLSPEAPVPVVTVKSRAGRLGGAANVALNVKALGAEPFICSVVGDDDKAVEFGKLLRTEGINCEGILRSTERITTTKFRVFGNNVQMLRVDEEITTPLSTADYERTLQIFNYLLRNYKIDVIIFQDYDKGMISPDLIREVTRRAQAEGIPVTVDPKKRNFMAYENVTMFKPNLKELKEGLGLAATPETPEELEDALGKLQDRLKADMALVTLSEHGMAVRHKHKDGVTRIDRIPALIRNISDVSGAGDTVISVASLCLALGIDPLTMARIANLAGGLVCEEVGVVPVDPQKLKNEINKLGYL
jgi:rfaE bifunctional protein kinase chain/domain